jgi:hypothetical protein
MLTLVFCCVNYGKTKSGKRDGLQPALAEYKWEMTCLDVSGRQLTQG